MVAWNVPFRPHALVSTTLDVGDMANIYPQPTSFPDLGGVEVGHPPTQVCSVCIQDTIGSEPVDLLFGQVFCDIEVRHEGGVRGRGWYAPIQREPMVADRSLGMRWHGHELSSFWSR